MEIRTVVDPRIVEQAVRRVTDQATFVQALLVEALGWPIDASVHAISDVAYEWSDEELRLSGLRANIVDGKAYQIVLPGNPWGIFIFEFRNPDVFATGRGMTGVLRRALQGLTVKKRGSRDPNLAAFNRENLLFICSHHYQSYRFAYFKAPRPDSVTAPMASFGWGPDDVMAVRTICEFNLASLGWPDVEPTSDREWIQAWSGAFDVEKVTERFYNDYAVVFDEVETVIGSAQGLVGEELRLFTQALFNRLMFLRFIERKGWLRFPGQEGTRFLAALAEAGGIGDETLYETRLKPLFFDGLARPGQQRSRSYGTVPLLNGGLFEPSKLDDAVPDLPDDALLPIIAPSGLFYRYNFTVEESTSLDVEVAVDPEMLGKVFEELVSDRHGTGSYYTPRSVVAFMCREALKQHLANRTDAPATALDRLIDDRVVDGLSEAHAEEITVALDELTVLDPACGSGAYLLGLLHELVAIRRALQSERLVSDPQFLYVVKLHMISRTLYGADIDEFATEIAKLRLWLSLAKEELRLSIEQEEESIAAELQYQCGAGIIDWHIQFAEVFGRGGGFDIVLANPPYVSAIEFLRTRGPEERELLKARFESARGAWDLYVPFFERGLQLLRPKGHLAYISPNKYLSASYAKSLRAVIRNTACFRELVDLSRFAVFESASVYPVLTFLQRARDDSQRILCRLPGDGPEMNADPKTFSVVRVGQEMLELLPQYLWGFLLSNKLDELISLLDNTRPLLEVAEVRATTTAAEAETFGNRMNDGRGRGTYRVANTGTIDPYAMRWGEKELTHQRRRFRYPMLRERDVTPKRNALFRSPKVLIAKMAKRCEAALDGEGEYAGLNVNCISRPAADLSLEFLCGYCNSSIFMFFYNQLFGALRMSGGYYQFQAPQLRVMPVPKVSLADHDEIARMVADMCRLSDGGGGPQADQLGADIDIAIARVFGLTEQDLGALLKRSGSH
ncbi:MAG: Eco57I restriction-modification methylase domain-containing protein [Acidobacteria bacterium]|nr:Eco57I restriction-modification methylase domain-containing protein [Acidobacteriota bacterium]